MAGERLFKRNEGRVWYGWFYPPGRPRVQRSTRCTDKRAAAAVLGRWEREAADPDHAATSQALVRDAVALVLERIDGLVATGRRSSSTRDFYAKKAGHLSRIFEPEGAPCYLASLTPSAIDAYVDERRQEGTKDTTIGKELGVLWHGLKLAKRRKVWRGDIDELLPELDNDATEGDRWLTFDELQKLLAELDADKAARVAFIIASNARWAESDRAQREDVGKLKIFVRGTKTDRSKRHSPIVISQLQSLAKYALKHAQGPAPLLFHPWGNVRRDLHAACARAGIAPCTPNDLRRTYAHWMRQSGVPKDLVADSLGHTTDKMVSRVYGKLGPDELVAAVQRAAAPVQQTPRRRRHSVDSVDVEKPKKAGVLVPRVGIEPTTRGFSILCSTN
jgi:integrase